jgi:hypothetical protein
MKKIIFAVLFCLFSLSIDQVIASEASEDVSGPKVELAALNKVLQDVSYSLNYKNQYEVVRDKEMLVVNYKGEEATTVRGKYVRGYTRTGKYSFMPQDLNTAWIKKSKEEEEFPGTYIVRIQCRQEAKRCITHQAQEVRLGADRQEIEVSPVDITLSRIEIVIPDSETADSIVATFRKLVNKNVAGKSK